MAKKFFTLDEANELLPFVQTELSYLQEAKSDFYKKYHQLQQLKKECQHKQNKQEYQEYEDAVFKLECSLEFIELETQLRLNNIQAKGIQVKDIDIGLVDFPAIIDSEEVLLCWKQGESAIHFYHGVHDGFAGRKPID